LGRLPGTELPQLDFSGLAQSQGVQSIRVERPQDLDRALHAAFQAAKPMLLEVVVEPAEAFSGAT
jgi:thiamine pyrophosphate-dependent acetolactate synthase large subunit-like protein